MIASYSFNELTSFAHIAIGALFTIYVPARQLVAKFATTETIFVAAAVLGLKPLVFPMPHVVNVIEAITPFLTALVFFGTVSMRGGLLLRIVSIPLLQKIGIVSYSIYLWQQLSLAPYYWGGSETGATQLYENHSVIMTLLFIPFAILSYFGVERPMIKLGHTISNRIIGRGSALVKRS